MSEQVDRIVKAIESGFSLACVEVALEVTHLLVKRTPVDTGWASSNWIPQIGSPFVGLAGDAKTQRGRVKQALGRVGAKSGTLAKSGDAARESATAALVTYKLTQGSIFVANNVPYISGPGSLDDGHSKQAPAGFIRQAIEDGTNAVWERRQGADVHV